MFLLLDFGIQKNPLVLSVSLIDALRDVEFNGAIIPDHVPSMADDGRIGTAYTIGYMNALVERANAEAA